MMVPVSLIAAVACLFAVLHAAVHVIVHRVLLHGQNWYRMLPDGKKADYTLQIVWLLVGTPLPFAYAHTALNLRDDVESRWHGASDVCMYAMLLHVGQSLYESCLFFVHRKPLVYQLHHVIVVLSYGLALYCGRMHFWAAWAGLVESTNINLCILQMMVISGVGRGSLGETLNGACLWLLYLVFRVLMLPAWLIAFYSDAAENYARSYGAFDDAAADVAMPHRLLHRIVPCSIVGLWLICLLWFDALTKGMLKALRGGEAGKGTSKEA